MMLTALVAAALISQFELSGWWYLAMGAAVGIDFAMANFRERRVLGAILELRVKLSKVEIELEQATAILDLINGDSLEIASGVRAVEDILRPDDAGQ